MMPKIVRSLLLGATLLATKSSYGQTCRNLKQLDSLLEKAHNLGVFNGNLLVSEKGKIIYKKTIGWADASGKIKLTEDHLKPSQSDLTLTKRLVEAGKLLDLLILDHIILTKQSYFSFKDQGLI